MLTPALIQQIEIAINRIIDEGGHGEVVLPIARGRLLDYIERRPTIRMTVPQATGPPGQTIQVSRVPQSG